MRRIKIFLSNNFLTRGLYNLARSIYREGFLIALRKTVKGLFGKRVITKKNVSIGDAEGIVFQRNEEAIYGYLPLGKLKKTVGVHLHLYYQDLLGEMLSYLNNLPYYFDLYISCPKGSNTYLIKRKAKKLNMVKNVIVKRVENRGRDVKPMFVDFPQELLAYDYLLHIHTKKSLYSDRERVGWRQYSLDSLLGSQDLVMRIFSLFEQDSSVGLVYPDSYEDVPYLAYTWLSNEQGARQLFERMGLKFEAGLFSYPAGSFYFARTKALKPLLELGLRDSDFQEELGQRDGTMAHILERTIGFVVRGQGYDHGIIDYREGIFRRGFSNKTLRPYFAQSVESLIKELEGYDTISFDIFDTLITRSIMEPDDVFHLMEKIIKERYGIKVDYLPLRKEAERYSNEKNGNRTNIHTIYEEMKEICDYGDEKVEAFKELEITLELELCVPRRDVLTLFEAAKKLDKKIILVSDMYLTSDLIQNMLGKCGYYGYKEIWVSCEVGLRKDQDTLWDAVFEKHERSSFIHLGDNPRSDWQTLIDRRIPAHYLMSGLYSFKLTNLYDIYQNNRRDHVGTSLYWGLIVNDGLFNSPFALKEKEGKLIVQEPQEAGMGIFGPLFYEFTKWLIKNTKEDEYLAFLSREGYLLNQLYHIVINAYKSEKNIYKNGEKRDINKIEEEIGKERGMYFLSSRRGAAVAGSRTWEDIEEILNYHYRGKLLNLIEARIGLDLSGKIEDEDVVIDTKDRERCQMKVILEKLKPFEDVILQQCEEERGAYLAYLEENLPKEKWAKLAIVDVGYAGTIQYYLAKMLEEKISGYYLSMTAEEERIKPGKIGCSFFSMARRGEPFFQSIWETQLFLEAALGAPFGQFVKFELTENGVKAVYKEEPAQLSEALQKMQEGILYFSKRFVSLTRELEERDREVQVEISKELYGVLMKEQGLFREIREAFVVNDDYAMNGNLVFHVEWHTWEASKS